VAPSRDPYLIRVILDPSLRKNFLYGSSAGAFSDEDPPVESAGLPFASDWPPISPTRGLFISLCAEIGTFPFSSLPQAFPPALLYRSISILGLPGSFYFQETVLFFPNHLLLHSPRCLTIAVEKTPPHLSGTILIIFSKGPTSAPLLFSFDHHESDFFALLDGTRSYKLTRSDVPIAAR